MANKWVHCNISSNKIKAQIVDDSEHLLKKILKHDYHPINYELINP